MSLKKEPYRLYTSDHFNENYPNNSTYGVIPIIHARKAQSKEMIGVLWANASDTFVDVIEKDQKKHIHWMSEGGALQIYIFAASSP